MPPALIVTIDTEEEGLWSGRFAGYDTPVENLAGIPAFQLICDRFDIKPTYLVNSPVVENERASAVFESIIAGSRCEIGCHIHPWNTPPVDDDTTSERSYLCNLPLEEQRNKLATVTGQISQRFGQRPTSFRAGRYGLDSAGAELLRDLGYIVDSSVCPFMDYSEDGGPDFRGAPWQPYFVGHELTKPATSSTSLLEVPVSFGFNWTNFERANRLQEWLSGPRLRRMRLRGILDRLGILRKIKFSPEKGDASQLRPLIRAYCDQDAPCMVMMFHSSSLQPGNTPYVRDDSELQGFLNTIERTFEYCLNTAGMSPATLSGFARSYPGTRNLRTKR